MILLVAIASFISFQPLFKKLTDNAAQQYASGIFGSIIASILTMFLLKKQTEVEDLEGRKQKVFDEKIALFNQILENFDKIFEDRIITKEELSRLEFLLIQLTMFASDETIQKYKEIYQYIISYDRKRTDDGRIFLDSLALNDKDGQNLIFGLASLFRMELGIELHRLDKGLLRTLTESINNSSKFLYSRVSLEDLDIISERSKCEEEGEQEKAFELINLLQVLADACRREGISILEGELINTIDSSYSYIKDWINGMLKIGQIDSADWLTMKANLTKIAEEEITKNDIRNGIEYLNRVIAYHGLLSVFSGTNPRTVKEKLLSFLSEKMRNKYERKVFLEEKLEEGELLSIDTQILDSFVEKNQSYSYSKYTRHLLTLFEEEEIAMAIKFSNSKVLASILELMKYDKVEFLDKLYSIKNPDKESAIEIQNRIISLLNYIEKELI